MAHFAPVAPIQVLEQLYEHHPLAFGEYHLLLAHHTTEYADRFYRLFRRIEHDRIIRPVVIMDNSVVECGGYVDFDMMLRASHAIADAGIDVIPVLPDVMGKGSETREASLEAYDKWEREIPHIGFMAVCQGADFEDYQQSLVLFSDRSRFPHVEFLGIPRFLVHLLGSRVPATYTALAEAEQNFHKIHLLGYSDNMWDDLECSQINGVHGIDSAVPLRVEGQFTFDMHAGPRPEDWFNIAEVTPQLLANLGYARQKHALVRHQSHEAINL